MKFRLGECVEPILTGEKGHVKGRAEYLTGQPQYYVHYVDADGNATDRWFDEIDLKATVFSAEEVEVVPEEAL